MTITPATVAIAAEALTLLVRIIEALPAVDALSVIDEALTRLHGQRQRLLQARAHNPALAKPEPPTT